MFGSIHRDSNSVNKVKGDGSLVKHVNGKAAEGNLSFLEYTYIFVYVHMLTRTQQSNFE